MLSCALVGAVVVGAFALPTSQLTLLSHTDGSPVASSFVVTLPVSATDAAHDNAARQNDLAWTFGGKGQRGWAIYLPLIQRLIGTGDEADTDGFANAVMRWQKSAGANAGGVIDEPTLMKMIAEWQSRRLRDRSYPTPEQLLTAPAAEFYDPARPDDQRQIERQTYAAYKEMLAAAARDGVAGCGSYLQLISAFRSRERQEQLRRESPQSGRAGLAVNSPHFTGRALDLYVGGDPVEAKDPNRLTQTRTPAYRWLVANAERFGFRPYFFEPWHWEFVGK